MRRRNLDLCIRIAQIAVGLTAFVGCVNGPTAPAAPLPNITGSWSGSYGVGSFAVRATANLSQDGDGHVTGLLTAGRGPDSIVGTVTATRFTWHLASVPEGECPNFAGDLALELTDETVTGLSGMATVDDISCAPGATGLTGTMRLRRVEP